MGAVLLASLCVFPLGCDLEADLVAPETMAAGDFRAIEQSGGISGVVNELLSSVSSTGLDTIVQAIFDRDQVVTLSDESLERIDELIGTNLQEFFEERDRAACKTLFDRVHDITSAPLDDRYEAVEVQAQKAREIVNLLLTHEKLGLAPIYMAVASTELMLHRELIEVNVGRGGPPNYDIETPARTIRSRASEHLAQLETWQQEFETGPYIAGLVEDEYRSRLADRRTNGCSLVNCSYTGTYVVERNNDGAWARVWSRDIGWSDIRRADLDQAIADARAVRDTKRQEYKRNELRPAFLTDGFESTKAKLRRLENFSLDIDPGDFCANYDGETVALRTVYNRYWRAGAPWQGYAMDQQTYVGPNERFAVRCQEGGRVAFETIYGRFVRAGNSNESLRLNQQSYPGSWERFDARLQNDGTWAFRTAHNRYVRAGDGNQSWRLDQQTYVGPNERFTVVVP